MNTCQPLMVALLFQLVLSGSACALQADTSSGENGVSAASTSTGYYTVRPDPRNCASPTCGGFFVKLANQQTTPCPDGQAAQECYVAELDPSALRLSDQAAAELRSHAGEFLLHGSIVTKAFPPSGEMASLRLDEAWRGHANTNANGVFFRVRNSGIVCITFPCPSFVAERLNVADQPQQIADVDLKSLGIDTSDAQAQLNKPEGLLLSGALINVTGPGGSALAIQASEYYVPFVAKQEVQRTCGARGLLSCEVGEFCKFSPDSKCGATDLPGVCTVPPEICYKIYKPVCACDGQTYANDCEAAAQGQSVEHVGPC